MVGALCASANEESGPLVDNAPLTGYEPNFFDDYHFSETTEIFLPGVLQRYVFNFPQFLLPFYFHEVSGNTVYSANKEMDSLDDSYLITGYEPNACYLMETDVEFVTESLTEQQFPEQRFLEDVDFDDTALEEMLHNAHRVHVYHSQREGLSPGQSSSSVSERTGRPVVERTETLVVASGRELNVEHAQIRTF